MVKKKLNIKNRLKRKSLETPKKVEQRVSPQPQSVKTPLRSPISWLKELYRSVKQKLTPSHPAQTQEQKGQLQGSGVILKQSTFITHTDLAPHKSAIQTFYPWQKLFFFIIFSVLAIGLILNLLLTLQILIAVLSVIYFIDVFFNLFVVAKSLNSPPELQFGELDLLPLADNDLPMYSILCPLYREAKVLPGFLEAISKLEWPKNKLDVQLLLEADDIETLEAAKELKLPSYVRVTIVPHSLPKTKPKACNYGLAIATGDFLVIYDAEDLPDPWQLKKAYLGFQKVPQNVICLQAKLNYHNPYQNLLTRLFTAEYSLWFDITLTGLQSIQTSIPLGGTSNHFRTKDLRGLRGWDAFNVTEDCDLGIRLFQEGFRTAIVDSTTLEEANSNFKNWLRQRSRWIKGYMQSYLVHMRHPVQFTRKHGVHALIFQLIVGGKIAFAFINPFLWLATIGYFVLYNYVGAAIESLYPSSVFYLAVTSLVLGNFLFLYYYMLGCAKREQWPLVKFVFFVPIYWLMTSIAATIALYQLITKPHYWEKTNHGLHLAKKVAQPREVKVEMEVRPQPARPGLAWLKSVFVTNFFGQLNLAQYSWFAKIQKFSGSKELFVGGSFLILASVLSNVLNFIFNSILGRTLSVEDYGNFSLFTSFWFIVSIPLNALTITIAHKVAFLFGKYSKNQGAVYARQTIKLSLIISLATTFFWVAVTPFLVNFFNVGTVLPFILFTPIWTAGFLLANVVGYLKGVLSFGKLALLAIIESVAKLIIVLILISLHLGDYIVFALPAALIIQLLAGRWLTKGDHSVGVLRSEARFDTPFFVAAIFNGIAAISFFSLDIILAKHYLDPFTAGQYSLLSLVGKMVFFTGSLLSPFMVPIVAKNLGAQKSSKYAFIFLFFTTAVLTILPILVFTLFGNFFIPLLLGERARPIIFYLPLYLSAVGLYTIATPIISFYQAKKKYIYALVGLVVAVNQVILTILFHANLSQFLFVMYLVAVINFLILALGFWIEQYSYMITPNLKDLQSLLFQPIKLRYQYPPVNRLRILIFNWRDLKHKWAGGAESYVHELAKRWVEEGNQVTVFCGNDGNSPRHDEIDGVQIIRRGGFYTVYIWGALYYLLRLRGLFDVVIDSENGVPFFTPLYVRKPKFLLVHHIHQEVFREHLKFPFSTLAMFLEAKLMPFVYQKQNVVTVSQSSKEEILKLKLGEVHSIGVVHPGIDLGSFSTGQKTKHPSILYLGRLQPYKNVDVAINAFQTVLKKHPKAQFLIAGTGFALEDLQKMVKNLKLSESIKFLGRVSAKQKLELLSQSWIAVQPSMVEGWGITVIEANASGTPVIASNVNGLKDSVIHGKTGLLVTPKSVEELTKGMIDLIEDRSLREKLSQEACKWAKGFDWSVSTNKFYELIKKELLFNPNLSKNKVYVAERLDS